MRLTDNRMYVRVLSFLLVFALCFSLSSTVFVGVTFSEQGSDSSTIGSGGGAFTPPSGNGDGGGNYTGSMYYAAPGVTMQVVYYPYGESYNNELAYNNVLNSVKTYKAYDINGNVIDTIYNGVATTDYVFFAESASGRIYQVPNYDKNTKNGIIHGASSRYETAGVGDDMLSPLHHDCISGPAVIDKSHAATSADPWIVTMPAMTDVEKFIRHIIFGQGFGEWNKSSIALTTAGAEASTVAEDISTYANVLRLLGTSETGIQNYIDAYTGKLSKTDDYNVMVPTIIWTYIVVECGYDENWGTGSDWSVDFSWNGLGSNYVGEYFIYKDDYAYCCDGSEYRGEGGTHGSINGDKFEDAFDTAWKVRVFTPGNVVSYSHAGSAVKKGYSQARANAFGEVLFQEFWQTPHATTSACSADYRLHTFDNDHTITYTSGGTTYTVNVSAGDNVGYNTSMCEWYINRSYACRWMFGEHNWHTGGRIDYWLRHAHSTGYVNSIRSDYAGSSGTQYYLRGFWTPFNEQVSGAAGITKTTTETNGTVDGYCFKFENNSTGDIWYGKSDTSGNVYQTDANFNQLGSSKNYSFANMFNGEYKITEVLSKKGAGTVLPDTFSVKVVNEAGVTTVNTQITGDNIKIDGNGDAYVVVSLAGLTGHVTGGRLTLSVNNASAIFEGTGHIKKSVVNGSRLDGWLFDVYDAAGSKLGRFTTNSSGIVDFSFEPGIYTVYEVGHVDTNVWNDQYLDKSGISAGQRVEIKAGETTDIPVVNTWKGKLSVTKSTNTGSNLAGWQFNIYSDSGCSRLVQTITTDANGVATSGLLEVGTTYYVREVTGSDAYWAYDTSTKNVKIEASKTKNLTFTNNHYGRLSWKKTTNTGTSLGGWKFGIYTNAACTTLAKYKDGSNAYVTTDANGNAVSGYLLPGTYYVKEIDESSSYPYWGYTDAVKSGVVKGGSDTALTTAFHNLHYGRIKVVKNTNTGLNKAGWTFTIYKDSACTIVAKDRNGNNAVMTTDANGNAISGYLLPGSYWVKETAGTASTHYWVWDSSVASVAVTGGTDATAGTFMNNQYGRITLVKETNTGANRAGWVFSVYTDSACRTPAKDKNGNNVTLTTDANGNATSGYLLPGTYYVKETGGALYGHEAWVSSNAVNTVSVGAGQDVSAGVFKNIHYGQISIQKSTNTGENLDNWVFTVYTDANCRNVAKDIRGNNATMTTNNYGAATSGYLLPGTYYVKETGGSRYSDSYYWTVSTQVQSVVVSGGTVTDVANAYVNTHYGRLQVVKALDTDGSLAGWQFSVKRVSDGADMGVYTTDANGQFVSDKLLPGSYVVTEIIDSVNGLYYCETMNPVTVTVVAGQTKLVGGTERAGVSFVNSLRPMEIHIDKVNHENKALAGVVFSLEWSTDGRNWQRVKYSSAENVVMGNCNSAGLGSDGTLVTDANGHLEFTNLYPNIYYRVIEESTLNGYALLTEPYVIEPSDVDITTLVYDMTVVNHPGYDLPETGSVDMSIWTAFSSFAIGVLFISVIAFVYRRKSYR